MKKLAVSILDCNTAYLGDTVLKLEKGKVDIIHVDIADGHYVKNLTFGPKIVNDLKKIVKIPIDVHLAVTNIDEMINIFIETGADIITVQLDCCLHPIRTFQMIKKYGKKVGLAINPGIGIETLIFFAEYLDYISLMGVEPGFGGQSFEKITFEKIKEVKKVLKSKRLNTPIAVDGGINLKIAKDLVMAGVDILYIGSSLFKYGDIEKGLKDFRKIISQNN